MSHTFFRMSDMMGRQQELRHVWLWREVLRPPGQSRAGFVLTPAAGAKGCGCLLCPILSLLSWGFPGNFFLTKAGDGTALSAVPQ